MGSSDLSGSEIMLQPHVFAGQKEQGQWLALSKPDHSEVGLARGHRANGRPQS